MTSDNILWTLDAIVFMIDILIARWLIRSDRQQIRNG